MLCERLGSVHKSRLLIVSLVLAVSLPLAAQEPASGAVEAILGLIVGEEEREVVAERLERLLRNPVDINAATAEELGDLPFLDDFAIRNLLLYRSQHSGFRNIYELKLVQGMPTGLLPLLEPFITAGTSPYMVAYPVRTKQELLLGTGFAFGTNAPKPALSVRYEGAKKEWGWHFAAEKDKGEAWLPFREGLFDYLTGSVSWTKDGFGAVLGDFRLTTGQGLVLGQTLSYFSSLQYSGAVSGGEARLSSHRSFRETGFLRGIAGRGKWGGFSLVAFLGYEPVDARVEEGRIRTLYPGGLHRDAGERRYRHTARRETIGGYFAYDRGETLHLGLTAMAYRYRKVTDGSRLLPQVRVSDREMPLLTSADFRYSGRHLMVFLESVIPSRREAYAAQGGAALWSDRLGTLTLQGRWYGTGNYAPFGRPDGYSSTGRDERGIRLMWRGEVAMWTTATLFYDRFRKTTAGERASHLLSAKVSYLRDRTLVMADARFFSKVGAPERWSLTVQGERQIREWLIVRAGSRLLGTEGERAGFALSGRARCLYDPLTIDLSAQYFDLSKGSVIPGYAPYMPMMYGTRMLRNSGWFFACGVRYAVTETARLNFRVSHLYYTRGTLPGGTFPDLSLTVKF